MSDDYHASECTRDKEFLRLKGERGKGTAAEVEVIECRLENLRRENRHSRNQSEGQKSPAISTGQRNTYIETLCRGGA
jgi:hypothetical protein